MSRKCPMCGESGNTSCFVSDLCRNMSIMGPSFPPLESKNVTCSRCGAVYVDIDATQDSFTRYYDSDFHRGVEYDKLFGARQAGEYFERIYETIEKYITPDSMILDLGCGLGYFCRLLLDKGHKNVLAVDPSQRDIEVCRGKGIPCRQADAFTLLPEFGARFDLIILSHSLEHILDAEIALANAKRMLKPGGRIYIEVPDAARYGDVDYAPFFFLTYEHLAHFDGETFETLAAAQGLSLVESGGYLKCESYWVVYGIFEHGAARPIRHTDTVRQAMLRYLRQSADSLAGFVMPFQASREPIILWGIGASTAQLLATFDNCNVTALVDANPNRQNIAFEVAGRRLAIQSPESIQDREAAIVILPTVYKNAITEQIRKMGLPNPVHALTDS